MTRKTIAEILTEFLQIPGMTQEKIAEAMGVSQQAVQQVVSAQTKRPRYLPELIAYIEENAPHLNAAASFPAIRIEKNPVADANPKVIPFEPRTTAQPLEFVTQPTNAGYPKKDLPLYASAEGGDGEVIVSYDPIDYVERPALLSNVKHAYAIYVINDSMWPALKPGQVLEINPVRLPASGQYVVVVMRDGMDTKTGERRCMVKEFVRKNSECVTLKQYNPERTFDIPKDEVDSIHVVTGVQLV